AVGLGPVGAGPLVGDAAGGEGVTPGEGLVAGSVVGQDPLDGDPGGGEERVGAAPERGRGVLALVGQDFAVGQAGVIIDGGVQVGVTGMGAVFAPGGPAQHLVAAAVGDVAEFLDVLVHQLSPCCGV